MFSVLIRTSARPKMFARCLQSVFDQTLFPHVIVSSDDPADTYPVGHLVLRVPRQTGRGHNLYFNHMKKYIPDSHPWVIFLDDDDRFSSPHSLERLSAAIRDENSMLIWKARIWANVVIPRNWERPPALGDVTGIGFSVHKNNWIDWKGITAGDFDVISQYYNTLSPVWVPEILTEMQIGPGGGQRRDH